MRVYTVPLLLGLPIGLCFERRAPSQSPQRGYPIFQSTTDQICGYITADINEPFACYNGQYCNTISGFFGCCNSVTSSSVPIETTDVYTYTLSLTASNTETQTNKETYTGISYSYNDCSIVTACYDSYAVSSCTGACASNSKNLLW